MADKAMILKEILALKNEGLGYKEISHKLLDRGIDISPATVRNYLKDLQNTSLPNSSTFITIQETQKISTEVIEDVRPANKALESNNDKTLSKLEKIIEADQKALRRLKIVLFIAEIFFCVNGSVCDNHNHLKISLKK
ncbi:MAG: hypothetical protein QW478_08515 [Candidatus Micrarchaeaceae archaeon]